ncbi:radical SAM protein [Acinetobacter baumannii]|nr:radical SAM protein [Acinetobacter baumannii]
MVEAGIEQIRITHGEPLMCDGVIDFISKLQTFKLRGLKCFSLTTNSYYLKNFAPFLKSVELDNSNVNLNTLDPNQFLKITGKKLLLVLDRIERAIAIGLKLKINTVLIRDINDDHILNLVSWSKARKI